MGAHVRPKRGHGGGPRGGLRAKFAREIDPDGSLARSDPAELERRVNHAHRAHMLRMTLRAKQARAAIRAAKKVLAEVDGGDAA